MLTKFFPFINWFKDYTKSNFRTDIFSGLTVALVLIPQSMAYAQLAGLPAYYGLYAAFLPPMIAALFGSSRQLATGPVAVVSLMTAACLAPLAESGSSGYITYAIMLALIVGIFQLSLGILRLGLVVNFLSHPVVNGFTNAAAIIIATSQLSKIFGVYVDKSHQHYETVLNVCKAAIHYTHFPTLIMAIFAFAIMYGLKRFFPKIPNVLAAVVFTTIISWAIGFHDDATVDITAIKSDITETLIFKYNSKIDEISTMVSKRTDAFEKLKKAKKTNNFIDDHIAEHDIKIINIEITELRDEAKFYKKEIRYLLLKGVSQDNGSLLFYLKNEIPTNSKIDKNIWRIKVGNKKINTKKINMMGGGSIVGTIPKGLPSLSIPKIDFSVLSHLITSAVIISLLGFMEAISIAKAMANKTGDRLDPNQELIGQGLANILGAIGKSYPVSGSFSRSAVNLQAGAISGVSSVATSIIVIIVLLFFTPLLYFLPQAVLAAVIMMAVIGLINVSGFIHALKVNWYDGAISIITFIATLMFAPALDIGIIVGILLSLTIVLYKGMRPKIAVLSRYKDNSLRESEAFDLKQCKYLGVIRFDGPLFFANASYLEDKLIEFMQKNPDLRHILIVSNGVNEIDASGEDALSIVIDRIRNLGLDVSFSGIKSQVIKVFKRTHIFEKIGRDNIFPTMETAINALHKRAHQNSDESICPLLTYCENK